MENVQFQGKQTLRFGSYLYFQTDIPRTAVSDYLALSRLAFEWADSCDKKVSY